MTTLVRWYPLRDMAAMQSALDRLFDDTWRGLRNSGSTLPLDVHETDQEYLVSAALPGVAAENVNISLHDDLLTISGEVPQHSVENSHALILERTYGKFERSIRLPQPVDLNGVVASMDDGVLTLHLPKTPEAQPRTIPVKSNSSFSKN